MKIPYIKLLMTLSLLGVTSAYCQTTYIPADVPVTIALKDKASTPGTFVHDPTTGIPDKTQPAYSDSWSMTDTNGNPVADYKVAIAKPVTYKYDTKAYIGYLKQNGIIQDTNTSGWSLWATPAPSSDPTTTAIGYSAVYAKKGTNTVDLTAYFGTGTGLTPADPTALSGFTLVPAISYNSSDTTTYYPTADPSNPNPPANSGMPKATTHSGTYAYEGPVSGALVYTTDQTGVISFTGVFTGSAKDTTYLTDPADPTTTASVAIPGASKITFNAGSDTFYTNSPVSVSGTISFGASKALKQ